MLAAADPSAFVHQVDGVLFVVRYRHAPLDIVESAIQQIHAVGGKIAGIVFNAYDARREEELGHGGYGRAGKYGYMSYYADNRVEAPPSLPERPKKQGSA